MQAYTQIDELAANPLDKRLKQVDRETQNAFRFLSVALDSIGKAFEVDPSLNDLLATIQWDKEKDPRRQIRQIIGMLSDIQPPTAETYATRQPAESYVDRLSSGNKHPFSKEIRNVMNSMDSAAAIIGTIQSFVTRDDKDTPREPADQALDNAFKALKSAKNSLNEIVNVKQDRRL